MLTPGVKYVFKVIFVVIVISGLLASYIFMGAPQQSYPETSQVTEKSFNFTGPSEDPAVNGPSGAPSVGGPSTPPPASQ